MFIYELIGETNVYNIVIVFVDQPILSNLLIYQPDLFVADSSYTNFHTKQPNVCFVLFCVMGISGSRVTLVRKMYVAPLFNTLRGNEENQVRYGHVAQWSGRYGASGA